MPQSRTKPRPKPQAAPQAPEPASGSAPGPADEARIEDDIAYLSKRHRVSPAIVREIIRRLGSSERSAVEREIRKGLARR